MKYILFGLSILLISVSVLAVGYLFKSKISNKKELAVESENMIKPINHLEEKNDVLKDENDLSKITESELGVVTGELGFSIKYPSQNIKVIFNEEEIFKSIFVIDYKVVKTNEETAKKLSSDIHNLDFWGLILTAFEARKDIEFKSWVQNYLAELKKDRRDEKVLSEEIKEEFFLDLKAYYAISSIQGPEHQSSPHYFRKEFFIKKDQYIYHFSYLAPALDTSFTRSGEMGKKYLEYVNNVSEEIIKTFRFDSSTVTSNILPKHAFKPSDDKKEEFNNILDNLRQGPYFDTAAKYPEISNKDKCVVKNNELQNDGYEGEGDLQSPSGVYFSIDEESAEIHAYDEKNNHTGQMPGFEAPGFIEERARGLDSINLGSRGYGISLQENLNGRIEIVGKAFGYTSFGIAGDGNRCTVLDMFIPVTPHSVCKLPITINGDFGPFSCDIDGDGKEDYLYSLIYPLLEQKQKDIENIIDMMKNN
ncbi:MAG: hypothetical protein UR60_C0028G0021 [Candidatus Moranbacteria bacterium GW2011_GWF2_34_56]|nr:MAG: hypothetical protein UR51_C0002G0152 [Candidatus Moranbacteria bacterium GW2011_GWF1_34_10]KKP64141.1 MAG: hypothetical protein UR60_C0028G0021 [Candidatus Moranbacteria bacterium GW2011_GWF2_34_56]